jgi:SAM-dependent methyltransferase
MNREHKIVEELDNILKKTTATEKHRGYHILPDRINNWIKDKNRKYNQVFCEQERLQYIKSYVDFKNNTVLDIGCNTGYFLFSALDASAKTVTGYEGKPLCVEFINKAIELLNEEKRFKIFNEYFEFNKPNEYHDITILFNVLHHLGDDYGDKSITIEKAKLKILEQINNLSQSTSTLIYQMGFNWQGNINTCLFENGTKREMIDYLESGVNDFWEIQAIGIPQRINGKIIYEDLNEKNIVRDDSLGEFLNRPVFILNSKKAKK